MPGEKRKNTPRGSETADLIPIRMKPTGEHPKTAKNRFHRRKKGLPVSPGPVPIKVGGLLYFRRSEVDAYLKGAQQERDGADDIKTELLEIADDIEKTYCPHHGRRLRELAAHIPHIPTRKRKPKPRASLRRVSPPRTTEDQPEVT